MDLVVDQAEQDFFKTPSFGCKMVVCIILL